MHKLAILLALVIGTGVGIGAATFHYAKGFSYLSSDPEVCTNCHIMNPQHDSWVKSSHHDVATCVDCHLPHTFVAKYIAKGENGYHHSKAFTLQDFHEPIMINKKNSRILQDSCVACHADMVDAMLARAARPKDEVHCVHCHASVGHGPLPTGIGGRDRGEANERQGI